MGILKKALIAEAGSYDNTAWSGKIGGQGVTLYAKPLSSADYTTILRKHPDFTTSPTLEGMIDMIILKATDEHGEKAFDKSDKTVFMRVRTDLIGEIFGELFGQQMDYGDEEDTEDRVKN